MPRRHCLKRTRSEDAGIFATLHAAPGSNLWTVWLRFYLFLLYFLFFKLRKVKLSLSLDLQIKQQLNC